MRAYLPLSHSDLALFVAQRCYEASTLFAPTAQFLSDNLECDEEEIEYLLSIRAAGVAQTTRATDQSPGIVIALEIKPEQIDLYLDDQITLKLPLIWDQVQCALLTSNQDEELIWYATQEIAFNLEGWK